MRQRITARKNITTQATDYPIEFCFSGFIAAQTERGNSPETIAYYKRFYIKLMHFLDDTQGTTPSNTPISYFSNEQFKGAFMEYLISQGVNQQTVNSYLRGYRALGNWSEEQGYISGFKCSIKEVEPPVKQVYSDKELEKLMVKPKLLDFAAFRSYCIIGLILSTGARSNTILNIKLCDLDLEEGYVIFNTTKAHKVARLGLERKVKKDLQEWVDYWRIGMNAEPNDFLFCNEYGEKLTRSGLDCSIAKYNRSRGVEKTSIHLLRHTFAKKWITSGGDIISLARVLTHSELEMVKRYSNLYGEDIKRKIEEHSALSQLRRKSGDTLKSQKKLP